MTPTPAPSPRADFYMPSEATMNRITDAYFDWCFDRARDVTPADLFDVSLPRIPAHLAAMAMEGR